MRAPEHPSDGTSANLDTGRLPPVEAGIESVREESRPSRSAISRPVHELSIAMNVVETVSRLAAEQGASRVLAVTLRIGALSAVHEDSLRHGFGLACEGTALSGAELRIVTVPVRVWCPRCLAEHDLPGLGPLACPRCGEPTGDLRAGRELDVESFEMEEDT